jgi:hypothetical protein
VLFSSDKIFFFFCFFLYSAFQRQKKSFFLFVPVSFLEEKGKKIILMIGVCFSLFCLRCAPLSYWEQNRGEKRIRSKKKSKREKKNQESDKITSSPSSVRKY